MIETAFDLFHKKGIVSTSVDDILDASGTGKGQFYHYFKNKDDLIHEVLKYFHEHLKNNQLPGNNINIETWDDLERWFGFFLDFQKSVECQRSCPVATIAADLQNGQELLRQDVRLIFEFTRHFLTRFFAAQKAKGELPASADPEALACLCFSIQQGGMLITKIERDESVFLKASNTALGFIHSMRPKSPHGKA